MITRSLDHLIIEITEDKGSEFVSYHRLDKDGGVNPGMEFLKGDKIAGAQVLNQIAELIGYGPVAKVTE